MVHTPNAHPSPSPALAALPRIGLALVAGAVTFAAVATALPFLTGDPSAEPSPAAAGGAEPSTVLVLSAVHGFLFLTNFALAQFLPARMRERGGSSPESQVSSRIVRWALLEGAALFGTVIVLMAGLEGIVPREPLYYLNLVSTAIFALLVVLDLGQLEDERRSAPRP
jgi:hypothetical protein